MIKATTRRLKGLWFCMRGIGLFICNYCFLIGNFSPVLLFRDAPKPKRRVPPRPKEKKEKEKPLKKEKEVAEIKVEGSDNVESMQEEVKLEEEVVEDPDGPRK